MELIVSCNLLIQHERFTDNGGKSWDERNEIETSHVFRLEIIYLSRSPVDVLRKVKQFFNESSSNFRRQKQKNDKLSSPMCRKAENR